MQMQRCMSKSWLEKRCAEDESGLSLERLPKVVTPEQRFGIQNKNRKPNPSPYCSAVIGVRVRW
jgi:hypothetical protein